jgi:hypothetical protein
VDLFRSCVSWLRGSPDIGKGNPDEQKRRKEYQLNVAPDNINRLKYLPLLLMILAVIALGTGVWVVRRR